MLPKRRFLLLIVVFVVVVPLLLVACGGDDDDGGDGDNASDTSDADGGGGTSGSSSGADFYSLDTNVQTGGLGLEYPGKVWQAETDENGIYLATDAANLRGTTPEEGGGIINVTFLRVEGDAGATPITDLLTQFIADNDLSFGDATDVKLLVPAASAEANVDTADGFIYAMEYDSGVVFMAVYTSPNNISTYAGVANMIATSITFDAAQFE